MNMDGKEIDAPQEMTDQEAAELIEAFLQDCDLDDLAKIVSTYCIDEPVTVFSCKDATVSNTFQNGEKIKDIENE